MNTRTPTNKSSYRKRFAWLILIIGCLVVAREVNQMITRTVHLRVPLAKTDREQATQAHITYLYEGESVLTTQLYSQSGFKRGLRLRPKLRKGPHRLLLRLSKDTRLINTFEATFDAAEDQRIELRESQTTP